MTGNLYMHFRITSYNVCYTKLLRFNSRANLVETDAYLNLSEQEQDDVDRINQLCDQFLSADFYVIAAPMWSVNFPSILKRYIDCIVINGKTISITEHKVEGLLGDKIRKMVYIQSSGGIYPIFISAKFNHGLNYLQDLFKFLGIAEFEDVLVQGVDMVSVGKDKAIQKALKKIDDLIPDFLWDEGKLQQTVNKE